MSRPIRHTGQIGRSPNEANSPDCYTDQYTDLVCSNGGATYIVGEIKGKDHLNIENLMQTFENIFSKTT